MRHVLHCQNKTYPIVSLSLQQGVNAFSCAAMTLAAPARPEFFIHHTQPVAVESDTLLWYGNISEITANTKSQPPYTRLKLTSELSSLLNESLPYVYKQATLEDRLKEILFHLKLPSQAYVFKSLPHKTLLAQIAFQEDTCADRLTQLCDAEKIVFFPRIHPHHECWVFSSHDSTLNHYQCSETTAHQCHKIVTPCENFLSLTLRHTMAYQIHDVINLASSPDLFYKIVAIHYYFDQNTERRTTYKLSPLSHTIIPSKHSAKAVIRQAFMQSINRQYSEIYYYFSPKVIVPCLEQIVDTAKTLPQVGFQHDQNASLLVLHTDTNDRLMLGGFGLLSSSSNAFYFYTPQQQGIEYQYQASYEKLQIGQAAAQQFIIFYQNQSVNKLSFYTKNGRIHAMGEMAVQCFSEEDIQITAGNVMINSASQQTFCAKKSLSLVGAQTLRQQAQTAHFESEDVAINTFKASLISRAFVSLQANTIQLASQQFTWQNVKEWNVQTLECVIQTPHSLIRINPSGIYLEAPLISIAPSIGLEFTSPPTYEYGY